MFNKIQKIHLIGIGGTGMNGIAEVLLNWGYTVSGSDLAENFATKRLRDLGAKIDRGHRFEHVGDAQVVVASTAIPADNPEVLYAKKLKIPVIPRAEMLMELMRRKNGIAIAGAHGKTTTTSMVLSVLGAGGLDPTAIIGGCLNSIGSNAKLGEGDLFIAEADESDGSFLRLSPALVVITNMDREHMDHYHSMEALREAFLQFANRVPFYGMAVLGIDDPEVKALVPFLKRRFLTYGLSNEADIRGQNLQQEGMTTRFEVMAHGKNLGTVRLNFPGIHNVQNALAAVAVGLECQVSFSQIAQGLEEFSGIERRFQRKGEVSGVLILDDYAHHPREIEATLSACRDAYPKRRLVAVFQPHRFSRLQDLFDPFVSCFSQADHLLILPVYAAGEKAIDGVHSQKLVQAIQQQGNLPCTLAEDFSKGLEQLKLILQRGDLMITLGAGDVWRLAESVDKELG